MAQITVFETFDENSAFVISSYYVTPFFKGSCYSRSPVNSVALRLSRLLTETLPRKLVISILRLRDAAITRN